MWGTKSYLVGAVLALLAAGGAALFLWPQEPLTPPRVDPLTGVVEAGAPVVGTVVAIEGSTLTVQSTVGEGTVEVRTDSRTKVEREVPRDQAEVAREEAEFMIKLNTADIQNLPTPPVRTTLQAITLAELKPGESVVVIPTDLNAQGSVRAASILVVEAVRPAAPPPTPIAPPL